MLNFPLRISLRISSDFPYLPSRQRRQRRFFGFISPFTMKTAAFRFFFSAWNIGPEFKVRWRIVAVSVFTEILVLLFAVCMLERNQPKLNGIQTWIFFGDFDSEESCLSSTFVLAIAIWLVMTPSAPRSTNILIFGLCVAGKDSSNLPDIYEYSFFTIFVVRFLLYQSIVLETAD